MKPGELSRRSLEENSLITNSILLAGKAGTILARARRGFLFAALSLPLFSTVASAGMILEFHEQDQRCYGDDVRIVRESMQGARGPELRIPVIYMAGCSTLLPAPPQPWPECLPEPAPLKALAVAVNDGGRDNLRELRFSRLLKNPLSSSDFCVVASVDERAWRFGPAVLQMMVHCGAGDTLVRLPRPAVLVSG